VDSTAIPGREQYYGVTALDAAGNEGERSTGAVAVVVDREAPATPAAIVAEHRADGTVHLSWQDPVPAPDLWTYVVLRRRADDPNTQSWAQVNAGALRELQIVDRPVGDGFAEGATYRYGVAAVDSARNFSDTVFTAVKVPDLTPPGAPTGFSARTDGMRVRLDWGPSPAGDVVAYLIHRAEPATGADTLLARVPGAARSFRDERLRLGATYVYAVSAVDSLGNEGARSPADTLTFQDATPPRSPRNARAQIVDGGVRLTWEPVPGDDVAGYRVYRAAIPTGVFEPVTAGIVTEPTVVDARGEAGSWYRVRAVDTSGNESQSSDPVQAVAPAAGGRSR
jgi:fibronectin type 3 domain-containing protein